MTDHRIDADRIGEAAARFRANLHHPQLQAVQSFEVFAYNHASQIIGNPTGNESDEKLNWSHPPRAKTTVDTLRRQLIKAKVYKVMPLSALIYLAADQLEAWQKQSISVPRKREYPRDLLQNVAFNMMGVIFPNNGLRNDIPNW